jgi:Transposase DDE domain group 1
MMAAMVELFCDSFKEAPRRIVLDIDDTEDRVHGGQQLALFNACYEATASSRSTSTRPPRPSRWRSSCAPARRRTEPR